MAISNPVFTAGMGIIALCVVLVVGGMLFIQTYQSSITAVGSHVVYTNYSVDTCLQYLPNESTACGGRSGGAISTANWSGLTGTANVYDKDWVTNATDFINDSIESIRFTYLIPDNTTSAIVTVKFDNATGVPTTTNYTISGANCRNSTSFYTIRMNVTANVSYTFECIDDTGAYAILGTVAMPNESFQLFEQEIWWGINNSHSNYTAAASPIINNVYSDMSTALTTFGSLIPLIALAAVGGLAIMFMISNFGRGTA